MIAAHGWYSSLGICEGNKIKCIFIGLLIGHSRNIGILIDVVIGVQIINYLHYPIHWVSIETNVVIAIFVIGVSVVIDRVVIVIVIDIVIGIKYLVMNR